MIEKTIHYIWLGSRDIPEMYRSYVENWRRLHPEWEIVKWDESNFDCQGNPWIKLALEQKNYSLAADVIRSSVLLDHGGVYLDVDVELNKPLDDLVDENDFFIGYETDLWFGCAVLGAKKGHRVMREAFARYCTPSIPPNMNSNMLCVLNFSATMKRLYGVKLDGKSKKLADNVQLLSSEYFYPEHYITRRIETTPRTVGVHHHASTWHSKGEQFGIKVSRAVIFVLGKRGFSVFERIARVRMLGALGREYKNRTREGDGVAG